jgi:ATP synthase protein I
MTDENGRKFPDEIGSKERRRLRAKREPDIGAWYGLGLFGVVGWFVAVPTLLGVMLGVWIDLNWPSPRSWTLMLMVGGLALGCVNTWLWLGRQRKKILEEREDANADDH